MYTVEGISTYNLEKEVLGGVIHDGHVVGIPTYWTAHMEHQFLHEGQYSTHLIARHFRGVIMSRVDGQNLVVFCCISRIEVVTSHCETLQSDAKHLTFDAILHHGLFLLEDLIQRLLEEVAVHSMVDAHILASVMHPEVHDAGVALCLTHRIGNVTTTFRVLNPEVADALVGICQR